eukprot:2742404-Pyramimonas_sp.AAC.1
METEAGNPMDDLPIDDRMAAVLDVAKKCTAIVITATSRPMPAPPAREAARAASEAQTASSNLAGRPLWDAIIE